MVKTACNALKLDGKCWEYKGKYMGKYLELKMVGQEHDPDPQYKFENGYVTGLGESVTEVTCKEGGKRKTRKRRGRKRTKRHYRNKL